MRRYESEGKVKKYEHWEFLSAVLDGNRVCRGICAMDLRTMEVRTFPADAVIMATGGIGAIFGKSTNSVVCTGSAQSALYQQGCYYANGEFIQVHPTSIPGEDKLRLMSESARGEGGRVWVPKKPGDKRDPKVDSRERALVFPGRVVSEVRQSGAARRGDARDFQGGLRAQPRHRRQADGLSRSDAHRPQDSRQKLEGILEIYEKFVGDDPRDTPMKIFPGMHYTMGGLWVDFKQATNIPGIFAAGECEYQYHGANRLGANSLVSCIYGGVHRRAECGEVCARTAGTSDGNGCFDAERRSGRKKSTHC